MDGAVCSIQVLAANTAPPVSFSSSRSWIGGTPTVASSGELPKLNEYGKAFALVGEKSAKNARSYKLDARAIASIKRGGTEIAKFW